MRSGDSRRQGRLVALLFAASTIVCAHQASQLMLNYDVAGFLLDAESVLAGRRLFVEFFEFNMPSNAWLPVISVALARGLPFYLADIHVALLICLVSAAAALTLWVMWRQLAPTRPTTLLVAAVLLPALFLWYPNYDFGQREPFFFAAMAPFAAVSLGRHAGVRPAPGMAVLVGLIAALGASMKPHFVIFVGALVLVDLLLRRGRIRELGLESFVLGGALGIYLLWMVLAFPLYFTDMLPIASSTYAPLAPSKSVAIGRLGARRMILFGLPIIAMLCVVALRAEEPGGRRKWWLLALWGTAATAALAICILPAFGFRYHQLIFTPLLVLTGGLSAAALFDLYPARGLRPFVLALVCLVATWFVAQRLDTQDGGTSRAEAANDELTRYLRSLPAATPVLFIGMSQPPFSPMQAYADVRPTNTFSTLVPLRTVVADRDRALSTGQPRNPEIVKVEQMIRRYVAGAFAPRLPDVVIVDATVPARWFEAYGKPFSLINFLSEDPAFAREWAKYERVGEMKSMNFQVEAYRRRKDAK
jgi:hypothetical protein